MPTYDYICTACHHAWEFEQRIVDDPLRKCPRCGANKAKRQISSGAGFILKGSGWYADGYGSKKPASADSKSGDKASGADSKTDKKTDSDAKAADTTKPTETKSDSKKSEPKGGSGAGSAGGSGASSGGGRSSGGGSESKASAA